MFKTEKGRGPHKYSKNNENNKYSETTKLSKGETLFLNIGY